MLAAEEALVVGNDFVIKEERGTIKIRLPIISQSLHLIALTVSTQQIQLLVRTVQWTLQLLQQLLHQTSYQIPQPLQQTKVYNNDNV